MKKLIDEEEIERYTSTDWVAVGMAIIIGLAIALIIFDYVLADDLMRYVESI
jgi:hypothetical protein